MIVASMELLVAGDPKVMAGAVAAVKPYSLASTEDPCHSPWYREEEEHAAKCQHSARCFDRAWDTVVNLADSSIASFSIFVVSGVSDSSVSTTQTDPAIEQIGPCRTGVVRSDWRFVQRNSPSFARRGRKSRHLDISSCDNCRKASLAMKKLPSL